MPPRKRKTNFRKLYLYDKRPEGAADPVPELATEQSEPAREPERLRPEPPGAGPPEPGTWQCGDCEGRFNTEDELKQHRANVHTAPISHHCTQCGFKSGDHASLMSHYRDFHAAYYMGLASTNEPNTPAPLPAAAQPAPVVQPADVPLPPDEEAPEEEEEEEDSDAVTDIDEAEYGQEATLPAVKRGAQRYKLYYSTSIDKYKQRRRQSKPRPVVKKIKVEKMKKKMKKKKKKREIIPRAPSPPPPSVATKRKVPAPSPVEEQSWEPSIKLKVIAPDTRRRSARQAARAAGPMFNRFGGGW